MPKTLRHPMSCASRGANRVASSEPLFPAPAMPIARPWCFGAYHALANGSAAAKLAPATPAEPERKKRGEAIGDQPSKQQRDDRHGQADQSSSSSAETLSAPAEDRSKERSAEQRDRSQKSFLCGRQVIRFANERARAVRG